MPALRTRDNPSRSLEVTTDAPPTLAIISPTPRAFTFPININTDVPSTSQQQPSPYSSPSTSPGPDLRALNIISTPSPSSLVRTLSPVSPATSIASTSYASSSTPGHARRKSTCSDAGSPLTDVRPKKGSEGYVKRPENAFILFRRKCCEDRAAAQEVAASTPSSSTGPTEKVKKQRQADLSKAISQQWKSLPPEERQQWEDLAKQKKKEHEQLYPDYVYRPQRTKDRKGKKGRHGEDAVLDEISVIMPWPVREHTHRNGRSASMGAAPSTQTIQLPSVYRPSCPGTPSLLPLIERRSSHPGHPETVGGFDFLPNNSLMPPSFGQSGEMESQMTPDFFQNMFDMDASLQGMSMQPDQSMLLPPHQIISPASSIESSSSPSSPNHGPHTPTGPMASNGTADFASCGPDAAASRHLSLTHQNVLPLLDSSYGEYDFSMQSTWDRNEEMQMLMSNDFDLDAIPDIELGAPKFGGGYNQYAPQPDYLAAFDQGVYAEPAQDGSQHNMDGFFDFNGVAASGQGY